ncbi:glycerophosphodiester phosphodiesterase [Xanthomonas oryzae pv. oryzicola]|nr:glycerophosphodiester phosphodiesterase [Xanthomonas oryzae pv. oryzicola]AKN98888.1 glycerophosphodiester phosphodiesterase [Xanthomonas oryzae pv. oryzicola]AKO14110.1 glycerophosphodiester phosphodiesterase [Xanthomonas oryzae pv. oryzicola]AKO17842.1 glycerophosphodiester phosphodiesterase [Xanthomonas oryzae pv. oryzicola]
MVSLLLLPSALSAAPASRHIALPDRLRDPHAGTLVVSHRGCWMLAAENSIAGIDACIAHGIDMVEVDLRTTRDGQLVLMHDERVDRTTNGEGAVADLTAVQIESLHIRAEGGGAQAAVTAWHPPTFAQALAAAYGKTLINLDIKAASLDQMMDEVQAAGAQRDVLMNVPLDAPASAIERAHRAGIALQVLYEQRQSQHTPEQAFRMAAAMQPAALQLMFDDISVIDSARRISHGQIRLFVNTMSNDIASGTPMNLSGDFTDARALRAPNAIWGALRARGISMIQTDQPLQLVQYLRSADRTSAADP